MSREPTDQLARNAVVEQLDQSIFLKAGAGSGKTRAMVDRYVSLVKGGVPVSRIVAITFTQKAGSELKERIRKRMEKDPSAFATALKEIHLSPIGTIDTFVQRLLVPYSLEAGLPPKIQLLSGADYVDEMNRYWRQLIRRPEVDELLAELLRWHLLLGGNTNQFGAHMKDLFLGLRENWYLPLDQAAYKVKPSSFVQEMINKLEELNSGCTNLQDKLYIYNLGLLSKLQRYKKLFDEVLSAADPCDARQQIDELLKIKFEAVGTRGATKSWLRAVKSCRDVAREIRTTFEGQQPLMMLAFNSVRPLIERLRELAEECAHRQHGEGLCTFTDKLYLLVRLLETDTKVREEIRRDFHTIMVDEFQDTSPLQVRLLLALTADEKGTIEPGKLFTVGDRQQSIYRFRGSDVEAFARSESYFDDASKLTFTENFRSVPAVLQLVNQVNSAVKKNLGMPVEPENEVGQSANRENEGEKCIGLYGNPIDKIDIVKWQTASADAVARAVRYLNEKHGVALRDIAVLYPSRTTEARVARKLLEAGIQVRYASRSDLSRNTQNAYLLTLFEALANPANRIATVAALKSPFFAVDDQQLYEYTQAMTASQVSATRWFDYLEPPAGATGPVAEALARLEKLRRKMQDSTASAWLREVLSELDAETVALAEPFPRPTFDGLSQIRVLAASFDSDRAGTPAGFVQWLAPVAKVKNEMQLDLVNPSDEQAVQLMTVHASKGLEFEAVVVTGFERKAKKSKPFVFGSQDPRDPAQPVAWGWSLPSGLVTSKTAKLKLTSPLYEELCEAEKEAELAEQQRLLYVAATRAKNHLLIDCTHKGSDNEPVPKTSWLHKLLWHELSEEPRLELELEDLVRGQSEPEEAIENDWPENRKRLSKKLHGIQPVFEFGRTTPTGLKKLLGDSQELEDTEEPRAPTALPEAMAQMYGRLTGTALGQAVHNSLELVELGGSEEELLKVCAEQARAHGADPDLTVSLVRAGLAYVPVGAAEVFREPYLSAQVHGVLLEGFIDLMYRDERGWHVVDYKADDVTTEEEARARFEGYQLQATAYALMLKVYFEELPASVRFAFLRAGACFALESAEEKVAELEDRISKLGYEPKTFRPFSWRGVPSRREPISQTWNRPFRGCGQG
ncbi:MAG: UvrD-helicase domain-containing protein [Fimbriimonadaceae bacterium]